MQALLKTPLYNFDMGYRHQVNNHLSLFIAWQDLELLHWKYLPLSLRKPQESFLGLCMG